MTGSSQFNEQRHAIWVMWHYTQDLILRCEEKVFNQKAGISPQQFLILITIEAKEAPVTETDIAKRLRRKLNSISMIADRMVKQGLLKKVHDKKDRRIVRVTLTDQGKERLAAGIKTGSALIERMTAGFSPEEVQSFMDLMQKFQINSCKELNIEAEPLEMSGAAFQRIDREYRKPG